MEIEFYKDSGSSILLYKGDEICDKCVVLFSAYGGKVVGKKIGGTNPLLKAGFDVLNIQTSLDDWHQTISLEGLQKARDFLYKNYKMLYGFGSSMGGFAALAFSKFFNFNKILVFAPQYSLNLEGETRWASKNMILNGCIQLKSLLFQVR